MPALSKPRNNLLLEHLAIFLGLTLIGMGQTLLYAILGPTTRLIGISEIQTGFLVSGSALVLTVASPYWGRRIDVIGSRTVFLLGMLCYAIGSLVFALVLNSGMRAAMAANWTFFWLLSIRAIYAFMTAGIHPAAMAHIAISCTSSLRPARMALMSACFGVGSILGPLLGTLLSTYGVLVPLYAISGGALLSVFMGFVAVKDVRKEDNTSPLFSDRRTLSPLDERVRRILLSTFLMYVSFSGLQQSISFHVQDSLRLGATDAIYKTGLVVSSIAVAMVVTQLCIWQLFKPRSSAAVFIGALLAALGLAGIAVGTKNISQLVLFAAFSGAGFAFALPGLQSALSGSVDEADQGGIAGLSFGVAALGYTVGPLVGIALLSAGHGTTYWCAAVLVLLAAVASRGR